ncbi:unnamed protein product [[Candida] boidinii]|uniref:Unnamed protein product n=1 Tax=Candida boidinii TaxID=5477 RepID=A0A9W6WJ03_CANBO|nr:unnamed protein product [[Candida] boidinii]
MSFLNQRQEEELKKSVIQYLTPLLKSETTNKENENGALLNDELLNQLTTKLLDVSYTDYETKYKNTLPSNYLEKKWSTVLKLQKKIVDLENEVAAKSGIITDLKKLNLSNDINSFSASASNSTDNNNNGADIKINWAPSKVKNVLKLYNSSITSIAIHPLKPIVASASNDGMITIWNILDLSQPELIIRNAHTRTINTIVKYYKVQRYT